MQLWLSFDSSLGVGREIIRHKDSISANGVSLWLLSQGDEALLVDTLGFKQNKKRWILHLKKGKPSTGGCKV